VIGHSLGGAAPALAVGRLTPARAVHRDPAWARPEAPSPVPVAAAATAGPYCPATFPSPAATDQRSTPNPPQATAQNGTDGV